MSGIPSNDNGRDPCGHEIRLRWREKDDVIANLVRNRMIHWFGLAAFSCLIVVGCVAQQADVVRVKRDLDRKISELDKSKTSLQQAVAEANQALSKANAIITQQREEIKTLLQARADLDDEMATLKDGDLLEVRGTIDEQNHQLQTLVEQMHRVNQELQDSQEAAKEREGTFRSLSQQLQDGLRQQEEIGTVQSEKMAEFRTSLVDFQNVLTSFRETMVQQEGQNQIAQARIDTISRQQLADAELTTGNFEEMKQSINSVVSAVETVSKTLADRIDEHEQKLAQVSLKGEGPVTSRASSNMAPSAQKEDVTRSVQQLRQELNGLSQHIKQRENSRKSASVSLNQQPQHTVPGPTQELRSGGTARVATKSSSWGNPNQATFNRTPIPNSAALAYQQNFALLRAGDLNGALNGFGEFLRKYPDNRLASNAQYWLGECYYGQRRFTQAIQEFERVFHQYPSSEKVPAALLKIGYSNLELQKPATARAVFRQLVRSYPKSPEAAKAYSRLTEVGGLAKRPS